MTTSHLSADGGPALKRAVRETSSLPWLRNILVQTFIVGLIVFATVYFVNNAQVNLLRRSGNFGLGFMATPGSYTLTLLPIPLKNNDLVFRFVALGYVNTIIVSLIGIFVATFLGFFMGLARLSNNWLVARAATVYVELLRNIPLAVWLLFAFALALMLPNIVASAPISGPLGLSISNEKLILPALQFGDGVSGDTTWLKLVPFDWQLFKTVSLTSSSMGEPLVGLLVAILLGGGAALVLARRDDMARAFNDRELDTLYVWLGLLLVAVLFLAIFGAGMVIGISNSVVFAATAFYLLVWAVLFIAAYFVSSQIEARERLHNEPRVKAIGIIFRSAAVIVLLVYALMIESSIPPMVSWTMFWVFIIALVIANCIATLIDIRAEDIQNRTGERPNTLLLKLAVFVVVIVAIFVAIGVRSVSRADPEQVRSLHGGFRGPADRTASDPRGRAGDLHLAFIAETVRAGIQSVDKGQTEAANSVGLRRGQITNLIVIPQALRVIIPPLNLST